MQKRSWTVEGSPGFLVSVAFKGFSVSVSCLELTLTLAGSRVSVASKGVTARWRAKVGRSKESGSGRLSADVLRMLEEEDLSQG